MPTHCALKLVADLSFDPFERRTASKNKEPGNASKVAEGKAPILETISPEERARKKALTAAVGPYDYDDERTEPEPEPSGGPENHYYVDASDSGDEYTFELRGGFMTVNQDCWNSLSADGKTLDQLRKAWEATAHMKDTSGIPNFWLAAIGLHESNAGELQKETKKGGKGRGWYQIDLGQHPQVTEAQALGFDFSTRFVAKLFDANWKMVDNYEKQDKYNYTFDQKLAMAFRIYNAGKVSGSMRRTYRQTDDIGVLDRGTNPPKQNYVSTMVNLTHHCFRSARWNSRR